MTKLAEPIRPSDDMILASIRSWGNRGQTYVIANRLRARRYNVRTDWVLRQLKRLERKGAVARVPSSYAVQLTWAVIEGTSHE